MKSENSILSAELKGHFLRLYQIALSDDDFSPAEWKMLYQLAAEKGVDKNELDEILLNTNGIVGIPNDLNKKIEYLYDFALMIWSDGEVTIDELTTLKKYCRKFEFLEENIEELSEYLLDSVKSNKSKEEILSELV